MNLIAAVLVHLWVAGWALASVMACLRARAAVIAGSPARPGTNKR